MRNVMFKCDKCGSANVKFCSANLSKGSLLEILEKLNLFSSPQSLRGKVKVTCKDCGYTSILNIQ